MMIDIILAFILGNLATRLFYARINTKRVDWWKSSEWSDNKFYQRVHGWLCEVCPKRHYCDKYRGKHDQ
jgi:hypothetical protein